MSYAHFPGEEIKDKGTKYLAPGHRRQQGGDLSLGPHDARAPILITLPSDSCSRGMTNVKFCHKELGV